MSADDKIVAADPDKPGADPIRDPLGVLLADHAEQELLCDRLIELVENLDADGLAREADLLLRYLTRDLPRHMEDEERDLFPALRRLCDAGHGIHGILDQLSREHDLDVDLVDFITEDLRKIAAAMHLPQPTRLLINVKAFAETQRRHLDWENLMVLPLAREVMTGGDLERMGRAMAARRASADPGSAGAAARAIGQGGATAPVGETKVTEAS